ncbi:MAG: hypothetical protein ISS49_14840 [Anaerolineae bacterium]|nr:hypothetical protein [Anaerolineae bacterium]
MSSLYELKYEELLAEFDRYVVEHPDFMFQITDGALVVLVDSNDPEFSRRSLEIARRYRLHDDVPDRPAVYVDVGELAPVKSRIIRPCVVSTPESFQTMLASEPVLRRDWEKPEEEIAWAHL